MINMEHCRFENTYRALLECQEYLEEKGVLGIIEETNKYEKPYISKLIKLCRDIVDKFDDQQKPLSEKKPIESQCYISTLDQSGFLVKKCFKECDWIADTFDKMDMPLTEYCVECGAKRDFDRKL
jgi:hypothetical protein